MHVVAADPVEKSHELPHIAVVDMDLFGTAQRPAFYFGDKAAPFSLHAARRPGTVREEALHQFPIQALQAAVMGFVVKSSGVCPYAADRSSAPVYIPVHAREAFDHMDLSPVEKHLGDPVSMLQKILKEFLPGGNKIGENGLFITAQQRELSPVHPRRRIALLCSRLPVSLPENTLVCLLRIRHCQRVGLPRLAEDLFDRGMRIDPRHAHAARLLKFFYGIFREELHKAGIPVEKGRDGTFRDLIKKPQGF